MRKNAFLQNGKSAGKSLLWLLVSGMEFVEIILDSQAEGGSLELAFEPAQGGATEFNVQVWKLARDGDGRLVRIPTQANVPDLLMSSPATHSCSVPETMLEKLVPGTCACQRILEHSILICRKFAVALPLLQYYN